MTVIRTIPSLTPAGPEEPPAGPATTGTTAGITAGTATSGTATSGTATRTPRRSFVRKAAAIALGTGATLLKAGAILLKIKGLTVLLSMLASVAAYSLFYGWTFAAGFVALIFVHEMGHVVAMRCRGQAASAPMFIPFVGAFISMKEAPTDAYAEAEAAFAGPLIGTAGAAAVAVLGHTLGSTFLVNLAFTGFLVNLFNLLPMLPLDGGRVVAALHPAIWLAGLAALLALAITHPSPILLLILIFGGIELFVRWRNRKSPESKAYYRVPARRRLIVGVAYFALILALVVACDLTYIPRHL